MYTSRMPHTKISVSPTKSLHIRLPVPAWEVLQELGKATGLPISTYVKMQLTKLVTRENNRRENEREA